MKNSFLANFGFTDRVYPVLTRLPGFVRSGVASWVPRHLGKRLAERGVPDRLTFFVTDECNLKCPHCFIITDHQEKVSWQTGR